MMLPVLLLLVAIWLTVMRRPDTPIAKAVWRLTVTWPINCANRVRRGHLLVGLIFTVVAVMAIHWIGQEATQLLAMGAPDISAWLVSFEVATYVDALAAIALAASTVRLKATWSSIIVRLPLFRRAIVGQGRPRTRPKPKRRFTPSNDDDGRLALAA